MRRRHEVRPGIAPRSGRRHRRPHHPSGQPGAQEGHADRRAEVAALEAAGITDIVVARLEPGDVSEDEAAAEIAKAVAGEGVHVDRAFTGRGNLFAERPACWWSTRTPIDRLNRIDEAITFATLRRSSRWSRAR